MVKSRITRDPYIPVYCNWFGNISQFLFLDRVESLLTRMTIYFEVTKQQYFKLILYETRNGHDRV